MKYLVEYLPRIGSVNIIIENVEDLIVRISSETEVGISYRENDMPSSSIVKLPCEVSIDQPVNLVKRTGNEAAFTLRLKASSSRISEANVYSDFQGKWSKNQLLQSSKFKLKCFNCNSDIIDEQNYRKLNDMPSEYWAELMDYWHCHKPDIHNGSTQVYNTGNAYASLKPLDGEILIGGSYFMMTEKTLKERICIDDNEDNSSLYCGQCSCKLGERSTNNLLKIYKWQLTLETLDGLSHFAPKDDIIISLLELANAHSERRILLKCGSKVVLVWLFTVGLGITLSAGTSYNNAIKVFYDENPTIEKDKTPEELTALQKPFDQFMDHLATQYEIIPTSARSIGPLKVGYFDLDSIF
ncbi:putative polyadenylation protein NDAI_0J03000 [Naumovozyma dairenensis CBS 421]|uniref:Ubiquitin-conjugating enzyme E2C-binding protein n=1 Tax=Naumovozyma dairenensis (strain ATCC 10597 / BCRC 20456 / CBS 421 / NBRC 0211 / NRRL Y-12639) TaxID=1071378 RepID=G0WHB4_NAUDC|nr:hypothetical protein NDAI_0J03000 [Naumovozyma dairenensis CBS 421]CCD27192.1 hypothetical protein NDAI_0J03000 [Naumovozyma dairenensis CBS 421]